MVKKLPTHKKYFIFIVDGVESITKKASKAHHPSDDANLAHARQISGVWENMHTHTPRDNVCDRTEGLC